MSTTSTLNAIRAQTDLISKAHSLELDAYRRQIIDAACELHDLLDELDHALSNGKSLPQDWRRSR